MKVLVIGSGGREHALCWALRASPLCQSLLCAPGNAGIAEIAQCLDVASDDVAGLVQLARDENVDFVVVGPEAPLVAGLVDQLEAEGILAFGPRAAAAAIEGSKGFMKDLCARLGVPTAAYERFDEPDQAKEYIHRAGVPLVVKADGLAAGKGVILCHNENEAFAAVDHLMTEAAFGSAGEQLVIEELLQGEEASFFALVHGEEAVPLASAQDHKAAFDGDLGPNTGGMGAYSPAPIITPAIAEEVMEGVIKPVIRGLVEEGRPYSGVLYAGLMFTSEGIKVLEFNARFGDPECQPLILRLKSDLLAALVACAEGRMTDVELDWYTDPALVVVMAANGYPGHYPRGSVIGGLDAAAGIPGITVFHAGTKREDGPAGGRLIADGGRVLGIAARAGSVAEAQALAYRAVDRIDWPGGFCRRDIGWRAVGRI
ncbi:MAG: phosphoribosylamine--glycine ligase [Rhodospirillales bacterium]|nr:phosphoribosylamine--glycine ligase [Rhodospirillales bacterium]